MPYIPEEDRERLAFTLSPKTAGELNYELTRTIIDYMFHHAANYQTLNDIMGALESCKQEFYRRIVVPYEDQKIASNGDVYS